MTAQAQERFWSHVKKGDGCWEWTASTNPAGYGQFFIGRRGKRNIRAHRFSWEATHGSIPAGAIVRHKCDNKLCVRPDHLELGSYRDNNADAVLRGSNSQLLDSTVLAEIMGSSGSTRVVAARFGVTQKTAWRILSARLIAERAGYVSKEKYEAGLREAWAAGEAWSGAGNREWRCRDDVERILKGGGK